MKIVASLISRLVPAALFRVLYRTSHLTSQMRLSYLPPLIVYLAAGVSGLTGIVGTFFVKDHLDLPAEFLAMLGFWVGLPWALNVPLGHLAILSGNGDLNSFSRGLPSSLPVLPSCSLPLLSYTPQ